MTTRRIKAVSIENYQAIRKIEIHPGESALLCIGGRNKQGKSSLLNALEVILGGKRFAGPKPVRDGEDAADLMVELEGDLTIRRRITANGSWSIEVRDQGARCKSPQAILDKLVGARFLDPLQFLRAKPADQRELLLQCARIEFDLDDNAKQRRAAYDRRTDVGRDLRRREAELANLGKPEPEPEVPSVDEAQVKARELRDQLSSDQQARARAKEIKVRKAAIEAELEDLDAELRTLDAEADNIEATLAMESVDPAELEAAERAISEAAKAAADAAAIRERNARAADAQHAVEELGVQHKALTKEVETLDAARKAALDAADMPIAGLEITAEGVEYNGAPLEQASDAERLQVSLAIAAATSPELRDIWMRDGALCDDDSLAAIQRFAEERGIRVWLERVGAGDDGAIVIEGGEVLA